MSSKPPRAKAATTSHRPAQVRISSGMWRNTPLPVVATPGLRPTPDRVRQTLFNWLTHRFGGFDGLCCLDLFAGTGAHGFEAASRGAALVVLNELHGPAANALRATQAKLKASQVQVTQSDATTVLAGLERQPQRFDVVFLDPPFNEGWLGKVIPPVSRLLGRGGVMYWEAENPPPPALLEHNNLQVWRQSDAGQVHFGLLEHGPNANRAVQA